MSKEATARSAMKLALEGAANYIDALGGDSRKYRQALAEQPAPVAKLHEQEPVAIHQFRSPHCSDWYDGVPDHHDGHGPYEVRTLYASPPAQRKPLTDEEVEAMWPLRPTDSIIQFARAIEAAHGIKENT